ncbi:hypothetical protein [Nitratireductor sp. StC3]|uniref:hypothetical protein n=1 Tax=Nitratireductor sp. StC3 TaxID=2126741 RepID=UPI0011B2691D|nr:hypothetical protein [Nitratireductor sp. StC3]
MGLQYENLDAETRPLMIEEIQHDVQHGTIYISPWLTEEGAAQWSTLLTNAAEGGSDDSLAADLRAGLYIRETAERRKPKGGGYTTYRVPHTASATMAEGEFNRFYVRALCRRAIDEGRRIQAYRAKAVENPRPESEAKIGQTFDPATVLADLRETPGVEPALGLPPGPNSGLTVRLI